MHFVEWKCLNTDWNFQHWFRKWLGAVQATSHYLNQWWLVYRRIYASLGLNELKTHWQCNRQWILLKLITLLNFSIVKYRLHLVQIMRSVFKSPVYSRINSFEICFDGTKSMCWVESLCHETQNGGLILCAIYKAIIFFSRYFLWVVAEIKLKIKRCRVCHVNNCMGHTLLAKSRKR